MNELPEWGDDDVFEDILPHPVHPCGNPKCSTSTGIHDGLSENGKSKGSMKQK